MMQCNKPGVYFGTRGPEFKRFIISLLKPASKPLKEKYIKVLTNEKSMKIYEAAFTSEQVDEENNYQVLEMRGDLTGNKFIVEYMYRRYPRLNCTAGVKVVARLRINYGAKQSFSEISRRLGFWKYISAPHDLRQRKMKPLLEDVFEAWIGATELILDQEFGRVGVGYSIVYDILCGIFNDIPISLTYESLYDAKTRLKETFDLLEDQLGPGPIYREDKNDLITTSTVFRVEGGRYSTRDNGTVDKKKIIGGKYVKIGSGRAALKADAQQAAAEEAINNLAKHGWVKPAPAVYERFSRNESKDESKDENDIAVRGMMNEDDINGMRETKLKSKYQSKYESTVLAYMCRIRDWNGILECMKHGADPTILDSDGMSALDLLLIGPVNEKLLEDTVNLFVRISKELVVRREVWRMYLMQYKGEFIELLTKASRDNDSDDE